MTTSKKLLGTALLLASLGVVIGYFGSLLVFLVPYGIVGYPVLQIIAILSMRGIWLYLAVLPLIPMAYVFFYTTISFFEGLEQGFILIMMASPVALIYLLILIIAHKTFSSE